MWDKKYRKLRHDQSSYRDGPVKPEREDGLFVCDMVRTHLEMIAIKSECGEDGLGKLRILPGYDNTISGDEH